MLKMENYQGTTNYNLVEDIDIVNNLTSSDTNKALSANQGKILNTSLNTINKFFGYSNDEVDTGLKWNDGRPIYRKCLVGDLGTSIKGSINFSLIDIDFVFLDDCSILWTSKSGTQYFYPINCIGSTRSDANTRDITYSSIKIFFDSFKINLECGESFTGWHNIFYITVLYVKKSDKE